jgi:hypothetical protein
LILQAVDQASPMLNKFGGGVKNTFTELNSAISLMQRGFDAVSNVIDQTVGSYDRYAISVRNSARLSGQSTDEMSRMVQVADDVLVSQEALTTAMQAASRQGIDVSINGLARLSDQYLDLSNAQERAQFTMKTFGRGGADMAAIMELGSSAIKDRSAAIEQGLVITDAASKQAREYEIALDNLNDSFLATKYTLAAGLVPSLTAVMTGLAMTDKERLQLSKDFEGGLPIVMSQRAALRDLGIEYINVADASRAFGMIEGKTRKAISGVVEEARKIGESHLEMGASIHITPVFDWGGADMGDKGKIESLMNQSKYMKAGGGLVGEALKSVTDNLANLSPDQVQKALKPIYAGQLGAMVAAGQESQWQADVDYQKMFGGTFTQAEADIKNIKKGLQDLPKQTDTTVSVDIKLNISEADRKLLLLIGADAARYSGISITSDSSGGQSSSSTESSISNSQQPWLTVP